jgi:hypothetical protein
MASFSERITIYIDTQVDNAKTSLNGFKKSVADAEGATGKLKAAAGGLGNAVSGAASALLSPAGLAAGAAAVGGAAIKAVSQFETLGLAVSKVAETTGLSADEASRWIEVAGDAGVSSDDFATDIGKLEKALGKNSGALEEFGISAIKAKDGTVDMNATILNAADVINSIQDPIEKQKAGIATFGKSWSSMSELIRQGSDGLVKSLAAVQDSKVLDEADVQSAFDLKEGFDAISDAVDGLFLTMGKSLAPAVAKLATELGKLITKAEPAFKVIGDGLATALEDLGPVIEGVGDLADALGKIQTAANKPIGERSTLDTIKRTALDALNPVDQVRHKWQDLEDQLATSPDLSGSIAAQIGPRMAEASRLTAEATAYLAQHATAAQNDADVAAEQAANTAKYAAELEQANRNTAAETELLNGVNEALKTQASELQTAADALNKQSGAYGNAADDTIAYNDALDKFNKVAADATASTEDVRDAAISAAKAHTALYTSTTEAAGGVATATGKLDAQNSSLLTTARTANGPAKEAIINYIATLNGISTDVATEIVANADTEQAEADLKTASANRQTTIKADADTAQANKDLDAVVNKKRTIVLTPVVGRYAHGGTVDKRGGIGGEEGAELITLPDGRTLLINGPTPLPPGTRVTSTAKTRQILRKRRSVVPRYAGGTSSSASIPVAAGFTFAYYQQAPIYGVNDLRLELELWGRRIAQQLSVGRRP